MITRIPGIGYVDPRTLRWVSELDVRVNMGLPFRGFRFRLEGLATEFTTASHTVTVDPAGNQTFTPTATAPDAVTEAHTLLIRAWEASEKA